MFPNYVTEVSVTALLMAPRIYKMIETVFSYFYDKRKGDFARAKRDVQALKLHLFLDLPLAIGLFFLIAWLGP